MLLAGLFAWGITVTRYARLGIVELVGPMLEKIVEKIVTVAAWVVCFAFVLSGGVVIGALAMLAWQFRWLW